MDGVFLLLEFLYEHFCRVRYLLVIVEEEFLTDDLCDEETHRFVGQRVFAEEGWRRGKELDDAGLQVVYVEVLDGADGEDLSVGKTLLPGVYEGFELLIVLEEVYLVDDEEHRHCLLGHAVEEVLVFLGVFYYV